METANIINLIVIVVTGEKEEETRFIIVKKGKFFWPILQ